MTEHREKPLALDMPFEEALKRFILADPNERPRKPPGRKREPKPG